MKYIFKENKNFFILELEDIYVSYILRPTFECTFGPTLE